MWVLYNNQQLFNLMIILDSCRDFIKLIIKLDICDGSSFDLHMTSPIRFGFQCNTSGSLPRILSCISSLPQYSSCEILVIVFGCYVTILNIRGVQLEAMKLSNVVSIVAIGR